jgi:uncharacterized protein YkvS
LNILDEAKKFIALMQEGREGLAGIVDAVKDGKVAVDATTQAELNSMLEKERAETKEAHDNLQNAINASRAGAT